MAETPSRTMRSGFLPHRIVHLHPTRLCNLACLHCYSESGPGQRDTLDLPLLRAVLPLLKEEGYEQISISGGDPLTYGSLPALIDCAHEQGLRVTMITNGLFPPKRVDEAAARVDALAISFDGCRETHNRIRGRADAFDRATETLARLAADGRPVAAAISVTREAIAELPDLADHLVAAGARALQVRPVAAAGRARKGDGLASFTAADRARLYLVTMALREELGEAATLQCDLAPAQALWQQRDAYAALLAACSDDTAERPLADLVNPLVITENGVMKPIAYDFHPSFDVGSVEGAAREGVAAYKRRGVAAFRELIGSAVARLEGNGGLVDWFDACARLSEQPAAPPLARAI